MKEIGSEFHIEQIPSSLYSGRDSYYVLSGRTAIDALICYAKTIRDVRSVYMPAYCCESMIEPFVRNGVHVELYDMELADEGIVYHIDSGKKTDILYVNNYFGYNDNLAIEIIKEFKKRDVLVLYDRTHSMLMRDEDYVELADFTFCSIRKWMGVVTGAMLSVKGGGIDLNLEEVCYWKEKAEAMLSKASYLEGDKSVKKQTFLDAFGRFNHFIARDYINKRMDDLSYTIWKNTDLQAIRRRRLRNADILQRGLRDVMYIADMADGCCPIFVPVFFDSKEKRDKVRNILIQENIYCPVHWPKNPAIIGTMKVNRLYDTELSLICDQRYGENDMQRITDTINKLLK